jgi:ABC transporter, substrate-binding protein, aliphatic sulfonates
MILKDAFVLSKNGKPIGNIVWTQHIAEKPRLHIEKGELSGDAEAVSMLEAAMKKAVSDQIIDNVSPMPGGGDTVTHPLLYDGHFVAALRHSGFDLPPDDSGIMMRIRGAGQPFKHLGITLHY